MTQAGALPRNEGTAPEVRRRMVFYVPGYDPFPARRYREMYRGEGARQAAICGYGLEVSGEPGGAGWTVAGRFGAARVGARVEVLEWADLVRASMAPGVPATYGLMLRTLMVYVATGALGALMRLRPVTAIAAFWPVVALLAQLALAAGLAWGLAVSLPGGAGWIAGPAAGAVVLVAFRRLDGRLYVHYLLHGYALVARHRGAWPADVDARIDAFAARIGAALEAGEADEVLVAGHSLGAAVAVSALARALRGRDGVRPAVALLTLGHCIPIQSFLPDARALRGDLHDLAARPDLFWLDVTAPGDGACHALCDPVAVTGVAPDPQHGPRVISAAFTRTLAPETRAALRWRFFRLHFQYLCAFDWPGAHDWFAITAGPLTLRDRFAGRPHSPRRVTRALSPYRDRA